MRAGKTKGGLVNIAYWESARLKWFLTSNILAEYAEAIRALAGLRGGSWSEQHKDMNPSNVQHDRNDLMKFQTYFNQFNPFVQEDSDILRNISSGLIASNEVNCYKFKEVGDSIIKGVDGKKFGDVKFKRSEQVQTFGIMRKHVQIGNEKLSISSAELFQRLVSPDVFAYELASVSPSIFHDDGMMQKSTKAALVKRIITIDENFLVEDPKPSN